MPFLRKNFLGKQIPWSGIPWNDIPWKKIFLLCRITDKNKKKFFD
jgi:hypothetical protein